MVHVLIVDDSLVMRQLIRSMLETEEYTLGDVSDGVEALQALRASALPGIVLLDYRMPNLDGWEVLKTVAAAGPPLSDHQFIVISAEASTFPSAYIELLLSMSIRIMPKPFSRDALLDAVTQAADRLKAPAALVFPAGGEMEA